MHLYSQFNSFPETYSCFSSFNHYAKCRKKPNNTF